MAFLLITNKGIFMSEFVSQVYDFSNANKQLTYNFSYPLKSVVFTKGKAIVDDEATCAALDSILEATSLGMYVKRDFDESLDRVTVLSTSVSGTGQSDVLINGILSSGVLKQNPAAQDVEDALAMALTQGMAATNELIASNPDILGEPIVDSSATIIEPPKAPIKLGKASK